MLNKKSYLFFGSKKVENFSFVNEVNGMGKMIKERKTATLIAAIALLGLLGDLSAQGKSASGNTKDVSALQADENMTGPQKVAWVNKQTGSAKLIYRTVQNMLDQARKDKDPIKITCLDDKLTQIHVNLKGIEEKKESLEVAVNSGDEFTANQQFVILKVYASRIQGLKAEAERCVGDSDVVIGQSETIVTIDEDITIEDPSERVDVQIGVEQNPHSSGYF